MNATLTRVWNSTLGRRRGLSRTTPIPRVNAARQARRAEQDDIYGTYYRWVQHQHELPCVLTKGTAPHVCVGVRSAHHVKTVGSGGVDEQNLVVVCCHAHQTIHATPRSELERHYQVDLDLEAVNLWCKYREVTA